MKNNRQPEIRFPGYTDAWEQRKLRDYIEDYVEKTTEQNQYPVLTSSQKQGIVFQEDYFADRQVTTQNNIGYFVLPRGYFTYRSRSDNGVFKFNRNDIIDRGIISYFYPVFKIINGDSEFFLQLLNSQTKKQVFLESEGTGQKVLSLKKFKNIDVFVPNKDEQYQIGNFFKVLNNTIALHQRELASLKQTKQGFLQKMFPKKGESIPEIRFPGFTDAWEQRKLGELAFDISDGDWIEKEHIFGLGEFRIIQTGNLGVGEYLDKEKNAKYITLQGFDVLKANEIFPGDLLISRLADPAGRTIILPDINHRMVTSVDVTIIRPINNEFDSIFLMSQLNSESILNKISKMVSGTSHKRISRKNLEKTILNIPEIAEQQKIGSFFKQLDDTIALHQRELELLQETKKAFLQKMFV